MKMPVLYTIARYDRRWRVITLNAANRMSGLGEYQTRQEAESKAIAIFQDRGIQFEESVFYAKRALLAEMLSHVS